MDDVDLLRQTIRRCTAVLSVVIAVAGLSPPQASDAPLLVVVFIAALLYLAWEIFQKLPDAESSRNDMET